MTRFTSNRMSHAMMVVAMQTAFANARGVMLTDGLRNIAAEYRSRGKGRGTPAKRYGNKPGTRYLKHTMEQECIRRRIGGWAKSIRNTGLTKREVLARVQRGDAV